MTSRKSKKIKTIFIWEDEVLMAFTTNLPVICQVCERP